jgi:hypothetical protein
MIWFAQATMMIVRWKSPAFTFFNSDIFNLAPEDFAYNH